jgi:hypothetical protein
VTSLHKSGLSHRVNQRQKIEAATAACEPEVSFQKRFQESDESRR